MPSGNSKDAAHDSEEDLAAMLATTGCMAGSTAGCVRASGQPLRAPVEALRPEQGRFRRADVRRAQGRASLRP